MIQFDGSTQYTSNLHIKCLTLGYDLDAWNISGRCIKLPVTVPLATTANSHILVCGMSGSGKSFAEQGYLAKLALAQPDGEFWFADYKGDDSFSYLRKCPRYRSFKNTLEALDAVYTRLYDRLSGKDETRHIITIFWDEYVANMLALTNEDKKLATLKMNTISEILLLGRSLGIRLAISCQRPDAIVFPAGSRLNYGNVVILGAAVRSIYEMLMPDFIEQVKGRQFKQGEGVALLQGSELRFIKIAIPSDPERMKDICIKALS